MYFTCYNNILFMISDIINLYTIVPLCKWLGTRGVTGAIREINPSCTLLSMESLTVEHTNGRASKH
jgi:hypothetical protein